LPVFTHNKKAIKVSASNVLQSSLFNGSKNETKGL